MSVLILGLALFFAAHSVRIVADGWRAATIARVGEKRWKGLVTAASLAGFALILWGFGLARAEALASPPLWMPPVWTRHLAALVTLPAFILVVAAYVSGNHFKTALGHPMAAGVALWAAAHLLANGGLRHLVLFGGFLLWALASFAAGRARDHAAGTRYPAGRGGRDAVVVGIGLIAWAVFASYLHGRWIGVRPFG